MSHVNMSSNASDFVYVPPFTDAGVIVSTIILIPLAVFGTLANCLTIFVISTSPKLKSTFNYFILSLCVSDLVSALISPLFLYRRTWGFDDWEASDFLCKVFWGLDLWTSYITSTHILCFASLRYVSVQWPHRFNAIKPTQAKLVILVIYVITFLVGFLPFALWFGASKRDRSSTLPNAKWPSCTLNIEWLPQFKLYTQLGYSLFFFLPILLVILLSTGIVTKMFQMRRARKKMISKSANDGEVTVEKRRRRKEKQIILQLVLIVGSFLLGYTPHAVFHYWTVNVKAISYQQKVFDWWFGSVEYFCLRISECLNPVFYNLASSKMRKETRKTIHRIWKMTSCSAAITSQSNTMATNSSTSSPNNLQL
ncbi:growth hormone secretagogue receptor type 1-like [Ciona intestinalis]